METVSQVQSIKPIHRQIQETSTHHTSKKDLQKLQYQCFQHHQIFKTEQNIFQSLQGGDDTNQNYQPRHQSFQQQKFPL